MDAVGMDLQLSDRAYSEYKETRAVNEGVQEQQEQKDSVQSTTQSSKERSSAYETSSDLATGSTVPLADFNVSGNKSTSSTSSSSSTDSRTMAASLYMPEYLTPSISYERQSHDQLLIALIGRAFDQPEKIATLLQQLVHKLPNTEVPVAKFTPFTVKRKALCRGNFDSTELKRHNLICLCYNASEARILLTGQDGYYTALLKQIEVLMGSNKVAFLISHYSPPTNIPTSHDPNTRPHPSDTETADILLSPVLKTRLSLQSALVSYLERGHVMSWEDSPHTKHTQRLIEMAYLEPNPQGILSLCSVM